MPRILFAIALVLQGFQAVRAQYRVPQVNGWRVHLSYLNNLSMARDGNTIYAGSVSGVFSFDESAREVEVFSKANRLSDVEVNRIAFDAGTSTLIVVYRNANIDLLSNGLTYNINSVLRQPIIGEKTINDITVHEGFAYLACSFGIVKIDLRRKQIVDSYQNIGMNGARINVQDIAVYGNTLYASSLQGLYSASLNSSNLADFNFWNRVLPDSTFQLLSYGNVLLLSTSSSLLRYNGMVFDTLPGTDAGSTLNLTVSNGKALCVQPSRLTEYNPDFTYKQHMEAGIRDAVLNSKGYPYMSIGQQGLVYFGPDGNEYIAPRGTYGNTACRFSYSSTQKRLFVAAGFADGLGVTGGWRNSYNTNLYYAFDGSTWHNAALMGSPVTAGCIDVVDVVCDIKTNKTYFTSFGKGVIEADGVTPVKLYDTSNTGGALGYFVNEFPQYRPVFASGAALDEADNLWVTCFGAAKPLTVKTKGGQWYSFAFNGGNNGVGYLVCDNNSPRNNKWIMNTRTGNLYVYNEGNDIASDFDDAFKQLTTAKGNGALPGSYVLSMALDRNGEMWIGTDQGLCIISDPTAVFSTDSRRSYDARQLVISTGSFNSIILGTEPILCIRVDGANRKWIGTRNGVWLLSEDGYTTIKNFTVENSPLLSNTVYDIGIFEETGEVFFATDKGIISYAGTATAAGSTHGNVLVYPNPVKPGYTGEIAIRGLVENANVKITDMAGNLVYETKANGGMATWNGITFAGKRAATGVYLIYSTGEEDFNGDRDTYVTKLLFVN